MKPFTALVGLCLLNALAWRVCAQVCLLNRIDEVPCNFRHPDTTDMPGDNEYGIYSTRIRNGPRCLIRRRNHDVRIIDTVGGDPRVKYLFSPGFELRNPQDYGNQMIVFYNISCPAGEIAFFNLTEIELEEPNCLDPNTGTTKCVDYIQVLHGDNGEFGVTESCGTNIGDNSEVPTTGNLQVIFRTSDSGRFPGFKATVTCVRNNSSRKKRSLSAADHFYLVLERFTSYVTSLIERYQARLDYLYYYRRQYANFFRNERLAIRFGDSFTYKNFKLMVTSSLGNRRFSSIWVLMTLDSNSVVRKFKRSAKDRKWQLMRFTGPGTLTIVGCYAFFEEFIVDTQGILPLTEEERFTINELTVAHFNRVLESPRERLCEEIVNPPPINATDFNATNLPDDDFEDNDLSIPQCPKANVTEPTQCNYTDENLLRALRNRNASNPILRTVVDVVISCTEREQPGRLDDLVLLEVSCRIRPSGRNFFAVICEANKVEVKVVSCIVDGNISLSQYCQFPSFRFPLAEPGIGPGRHRLELSLVDEDGSEITEVLRFTAPQFLNCSARLNRRRIVNVICESNVARLSVIDCVLDRRTRLNQCVFPRFTINAAELRPGTHNIVINFFSQLSGRSRISVSFYVPGLLGKWSKLTTTA